jgi:hypothetical protein
VGLFDILKGQRAPKRANLDAIFAMSTAHDTFTINLGFTAMPRAAVCFKPVEMSTFEELMRDLRQLLELAGASSGATVKHVDDEYGFRWVVVEDPDFEDLVTTTHMINQEIEGRGFSEQLLCSVFGFETSDAASGGQGDPLYMVYSFKRGTFYPFAPRAAQTRDNALELRLQGTLARELPMEPELERWYAVWGVPV